jgi:hypothetical protein
MLEIHNAATLRMPVQTVQEWMRAAAVFLSPAEAAA